MSLSIAVSVLRHVFSFDQEMITSLLIRCTIMYTMLDLTEFGDQSRNALCLRRRGHADQPYRNLFLSSWFVMQQITWFIVFVEMYHFHALLWFLFTFSGRNIYFACSCRRGECHRFITWATSFISWQNDKSALFALMGKVIGDHKSITYRFLL